MEECFIHCVRYGPYRGIPCICSFTNPFYIFNFISNISFFLIQRSIVRTNNTGMFFGVVNWPLWKLRPIQGNNMHFFLTKLLYIFNFMSNTLFYFIFKGPFQRSISYPSGCQSQCCLVATKGYFWECQSLCKCLWLLNV